jgi:hypothetical protein
VDETEKTEKRLDSLCGRIIESDKTIRFVGISNKMGNQIISRYKSGLTPLLTPKEIRNVCHGVSLKNEY